MQYSNDMLTCRYISTYIKNDEYCHFRWTRMCMCRTIWRNFTCDRITGLHVLPDRLSREDTQRKATMNNAITNFILDTHGKSFEDNVVVVCYSQAESDLHSNRGKSMPAMNREHSKTAHEFHIVAVINSFDKTRTDFKCYALYTLRRQLRCHLSY